MNSWQCTLMDWVDPSEWLDCAAISPAVTCIKKRAAPDHFSYYIWPAMGKGTVWDFLSIQRLWYGSLALWVLSPMVQVWRKNITQKPSYDSFFCTWVAHRRQKFIGERGVLFYFLFNLCTSMYGLTSCLDNWFTAKRHVGSGWQRSSKTAVVKEWTDRFEGETSVLTSCMWYFNLYATEIIKQLINQISTWRGRACPLSSLLKNTE